MNIDWFITNRCDQASFCRFCYAPWNFFPKDVSREKALMVADRLAEIGTKTVTICGGEPFMYPHLDVVVERLAEHGLNVVLYTSGTSGCFDVRTFLPFIEFLSLPVDAVSDDVIKKMRGVHQFDGIAAILAVLKTIPWRPKIKIGTVVTRQNIEDLPAICDFLERTGIIDVWRLYQFSPYGIGAHHAKRFLIPTEEFEAAVSSLKTRGTVHIAERSREDTVGYCKIIDSGGSFYRYAERYIPIGVTIFDDPKAIESSYDKLKHDEQKSWLYDR